MKIDVQKILNIGIALSAEKDFNRLLELILNEIMEMANCDAGTLYLVDDEKQHLKFKIMRNNTMKTYSGGDGKDPGLPPVPLKRENVCAYSYLEGLVICVEDVRKSEEYDFSGPIRYDAITGYHTQSMLVVPMVNRQGNKIGVIQLINALDDQGAICAFPPEFIPVLESVASQAAITIQNMLYVEAIRDLFRSFVRVMSSAIDERTPYNASHTRHMVQYGQKFIQYLNMVSGMKGEEKPFDSQHEEELLMSVWLHDVGKLVTPLEVMNKAARLSEEQYRAVEHRFEVLELRKKIACLEGKITGQEFDRTVEQIQAARELIRKVNTAGFVTDELMEQVHQLGRQEYLTEDGERKPWLLPEEYHMLTIRKGTLSDEEREIMEEHVMITNKLLSEIHFSEDYSHVREWASGHHEYLNGTGYPRHLSEKEIPTEVRMITILDIFDALVADDRPYKPGMPIEKALNILTIMAEKEGKLDPELTRMFIESRCWE